MPQNSTCTGTTLPYLCLHTLSGVLTAVMYCTVNGLHFHMQVLYTTAVHRVHIYIYIYS